MFVNVVYQLDFDLISYPLFIITMCFKINTPQVLYWRWCRVSRDYLQCVHIMCLLSYVHCVSITPVYPCSF